MKKLFYPLLISLAIAFATTTQAQPAHPNNGGSTPSGGNTPVGGGAAPLDGGIGLLILMATAYGIKSTLSFENKTDR